MLVLLLVPSATAWPTDDATWVALTQSGTEIVDDYNDHDRDGAGNPDGIDCVGDTTNAWPALYWWTDGDDLFLRVRVDGTPWLSEGSSLFPADWSFLIDTNGNVADWEYVLAATGISPTVSAYSNASGDEGVTVSSASLIAFWDDAYFRAAVSGSEGGLTSNIHTTDDWFVDIAIDLATLPYAEFYKGTFRIAFVSGDATTPIGADADLCGSDDSTSLGTLADAWSDPVGIDQDADDLTDLDEDALGTDKTDADTDDDGVPDGYEVHDSGCDPLVCDTDGDGLTDGLELGATEPLADTDLAAGCFVVDGDGRATTTDPNEVDSDEGSVWDGVEDRDRDGVQDAWETDPNLKSDDLDDDRDGIADALEALCAGDDPNDLDGDGVADADEGYADADGDGIPDFCEPDDDDDGIATTDEGTGDADSDGTPDHQDTDSDGNGVEDGAEPEGDIDCDGKADRVDTDDTDGDCADPDLDGVTNGDEHACGSNAESPDSDGDLIADGEESCEDDEDCDGLPDRLDDETDPDGCDEPIDTAGTGGSEACEGPLCGGHTTGGSCSTGGGGASILGALVAAAVLSRRRRMLAVATVVLTPGIALAEGGPMNAQRFHPAFVSDSFFSVADSHPGAPGFGGGAVFNYAASPLQYRYDDARMPVQILGFAASLDLGLSWATRHVAVAADMPVHIVDGADMDEQFVPGDLRVSALGEIMNRARGGLGLGVYADLALPTGNSEAWVGSGEPEIGGGVAVAWGTSVVLAGNVGLQATAPSTQLTWGAGASVPVGSGFAAVAELDGDWSFDASDIVGSTPLEWRAGAKAQVTQNLVASAAFGTGLTLGIGAPEYRVTAGVDWSPTRREPTAVLGLDRDRDRDGVADGVDLCPDQAEDPNGIADQDGCPDGGLVPTHLVVTDTEGKKLARSSIEITSGPQTGRWAVPDGDLTRSLPPGEYTARARAPHYLPEAVTFTIPDAPSHERVIQLEVAPVGGTLVVTVENGVGQPIAALVTILGEGRKFTTGADGVGIEPASVGSVDLSVWAENYRPLRVTATVIKDRKTPVKVVLEPSRVVVLADRVDIRDKVFFDLDSAVITGVSYRVLDDVAAALENHAELRLLEVQGHTDDVGAEDYNQDLSQRRAEAVRKYLIGQGVEPDRLVARGYGETKPLQEGSSEEARDVNRRVMFKVLAGPPRP